MYGDVFDIHDTVFVMDATAPGSAACRALKQYLADSKAKVTQVSKSFSGFIFGHLIIELGKDSSTIIILCLTIFSLAFYSLL